MKNWEREKKRTLRPSTERRPLRMHSLRPVPNTTTSYSSSIATRFRSQIQTQTHTQRERVRVLSLTSQWMMKIFLYIYYTHWAKLFEREMEKKDALFVDWGKAIYILLYYYGLWVMGIWDVLLLIPCHCYLILIHHHDLDYYVYLFVL